MGLMYPEPVSARMVRVKDENEYLLIRQETKIMFGNSNRLIGSVIMTNPGSFEFKKTPGWDGFKKGLSTHDFFEAVDTADLTMQNLIEVIRNSHYSLGQEKPEGIVQIYNVSNVVQSKRKKAEVDHRRIANLINRYGMDLNILVDPVTNNKQRFEEICTESPFIIMGFVDGIFKAQVQKVQKWVIPYGDKLVNAIDNKGRYSHPRRWRTEKELKEQAIAKMMKVLSRN